MKCSSKYTEFGRIAMKKSQDVNLEDKAKDIKEGMLTERPKEESKIYFTSPGGRINQLKQANPWSLSRISNSTEESRV